MAYSVRQLIARFRSDMDDTVQTYLWTDSEIKDYLDQAQVEFTENVDVLFDQEELDFDANDPFVQIPDYVTRIRGAYIDAAPYTLVETKNYEEWKRNAPTSWRDNTDADPDTMITDMRTDYVRLYPIPTASGSIVADVYRNPKTRVSEGRELEITNPQQQLAILLGARSYAYLKQDSEVFDEKRALKLYAEFLEQLNTFGSRVDRKRRRTVNVAYGGI